MRKLIKTLTVALVFVLFAAFFVTEAKAASNDDKAAPADNGIGELEVYYENQGTGYVVAIGDNAGLFSEAEIRKLVDIMAPATEYGNIGFYSSNHNVYGSGENHKLANRLCSMLDSLGKGETEGSTILYIEFSDRYIGIESCGANEKRMNVAKANSICDNVYSYASDEDYYRAMSTAAEQIVLVLQGARIAQPMKIISNLLLAAVVAVLLNYAVMRITTAGSKPDEGLLFKNLAVAKLDTKGLTVRHTRTDKRYSPQSSGSSGGHSGGGGHSSSGGGHHF